MILRRHARAMRTSRGRVVTLAAAGLAGFVLGLWLELGRALERDAWAVRP